MVVGKSLRHYKTLQRFLSMPLVDLVTVSGRVRERNNWWSIYYIVRQSGETITWYVYHDSIFWPTPSSIFKPLAFYTLFWAYLVTIRIFDNLLTWIFTPRYGKFKLPIYVIYLEGFSSFFVFEVILFFFTLLWILYLWIPLLIDTYIFFLEILCHIKFDLKPAFKTIKCYLWMISLAYCFLKVSFFSR